MEIELKFQVPAAHRAGLLQAVATARVQRTRLRAEYADTPDHRLAAAGLVLRLRLEGTQWVQTLKGRGDGLLRRLEHEVPLPPQRGMPQLDPARHAGTPAGAALQAALAGGGPLQPLYRTDIQRLHRRVRHAGATIEIAYDRGRILAGGRAVRVDEIEFELVTGPAAALPALAARWVARHGLWWDVCTKSERGQRLALGDAVAAAAWPAPGPALPPVPARGAGRRAALVAGLAQAMPLVADLASGRGGEDERRSLLQALRQLGLAATDLPPAGPALARHLRAAPFNLAMLQLLAQTL